MSLRRINIFSVRTMKEVLRDPVNLFFGFIFPVMMLWVLSLIYKQVGKIPGATQIDMTQMAAAIASYAPVFLSLFAGMLIAKDRTSTFLNRLFASPMTAVDFIMGYTLPMLVVSVIQSAATYLCAGFFGFRITIRVLLAVVIVLLTALMYIGVGLLCGTVMSDKSVGGVCGAVLTTVSFILSGLTIPLEIMGSVFQTVAKALPFYNAAQATEMAISGNFANIWPYLSIVLIYMVACLVAAIVVFAVRKKRC